MAEKDSRETRGKDGRPVTLPALYELLQQWQPPEEGDETSGPSTPTTPTDSARNHRRRRRSITRARSESEELQSSEQLGSWLWVEPAAQHSASRTRRASRRRSLVSGDAGSSHHHHHHDRDQVAEPLVRLLQRALRALHLRRHHSRRMRCDSLATQAQLPASNNSSLFPTAAPPPGSVEEVQQLDEQAHAEHRAWMREMRHRARHLLAMPEPEPFWLPHMLGEGADADSVAAAASATAATAASATSAANAAAIERPRQLWSATRSWSHTTSDLNDAATSCSDSASDSITTITSSSSSEQDATEHNKDLPSQEKK